MDIDLIGVPIMYGCDREGAEKGPDMLREHGIFDIIKNLHSKTYDLGNIFIPDIPAEDKYKWHENLKYLNPIVDIQTNLAHQVYTSLTAKAFPFVIGGDHSIGMGSIAGSSKHFKDIAVIWIDAHGDINDSETSPSGNIHGMPLAASMGVGNDVLTNLYFDGIKVRPENVFIIGARDLDPGEIELANSTDLSLYTMDIIRERGLEVVAKEVIEKIKASNVEAVHLSFDIDSMDSSLVPGTGTPVTGGFNLEEGKYILESFLKEGFVKSMDFVELNPVIDIDNKTTELCIDLLKHIFKVIK